jgi:hypothetical protein
MKGEQITIDFSSGRHIEVICIAPTKEMPFEVFEQCYRFSAFAELMDRAPDGKVIYNADVTDIWSDDLPKAVYAGIQNEWFGVNLIVPREWFPEDVLKEAEEDV